MGLEIKNWRLQMKRATAAGIQPSVPDSGVTDVNDHTAGGWADEHIYDGEFFVNTADQKLYMRMGNDIKVIGYSGMTDNFLGLTDTPGTFTADQYLKVNSAGTAVEYTTIAAPSSSIDLDDMPDSLSPTGYTLVVNSSGNSYELQALYDDFLDLNDTPNSAGNTYDILRQNSAQTALEFFDGSTTYVDLTSNQTIAGDKTFAGDTTLSGQTEFYSDIIYKGTTIDNITTDSGLTTADDNELATSLAVKRYIQGTIFDTGFTADYVDLSSNQSVNGEKTWNDAATFSSATTFDSYISTQNIYVDSTKNLYFGDGSNGSFRFNIDVNGNLVISENIDGTWTMKASF